jgi:pimeloyl-ACP methyl ester carboxylesterase
MADPASRKKSTNVRLLALCTLGRLSFLSPALGAWFLERAFLSVRRHPVPDREKEWLRSARPSPFESRGRRIAAWTWGDSSRRILLVHGWEGRGSQLGAFIEPLLERGFAVIAFDAPGHGSSEGSRSSLVEMGAAVVDAARHFGRFDGAVAHSAGAAATTLAIWRGAPIARLVYLAPPADLGAFLDRLAHWLGFPAEAVPLVKRRLESRFSFEWESVRHLRLAPSMSAPLLVLHDADDREIVAAEGAELAASWPGSRLEVTSGLGHRRILRDSGVVQRAVSFFEARDSQAGMVGTAFAPPRSSSSAEDRTTRSLPPDFAR